MICNWCGAVLDGKIESCAECGRKVPPMSDCGGFYHLFRQPQSAVQLNGIPPVSPAFRAEQRPVTPEGFEAPMPPPRKNIAAIVLGILSGVLFILCVVLLILLLSRPALETPVTDAKSIFSDLVSDTGDATPESSDGSIGIPPVDSTAAPENSDGAPVNPFNSSNSQGIPGESSNDQNDLAGSSDDQEKPAASSNDQENPPASSNNQEDPVASSSDQDTSNSQPEL